MMRGIVRWMSDVSIHKILGILQVVNIWVLRDVQRRTRLLLG